MLANIAIMQALRMLQILQTLQWEIADITEVRNSEFLERVPFACAWQFCENVCVCVHNVLCQLHTLRALITDITRMAINSV